jgi:tetratricopeptide (TPR) repeat protein
MRFRRGSAEDRQSARIRALIDEERLDEALSRARAALERSPDDPNLLLLAALASPTREQKAAWIRKAAALVADDPILLTRCARMMFHAGDIEAASDYAARATAQAPSDFAFAPDLWHVAGRIAAFRGNHERAEPMLRAAFEAEPESPFFGVALADVLTTLGRYEEALEVTNRSLTIFPDEPWLHDLREEIVELLQKGGDASR